jgi:hypothetical protein
MRNAHVEVAILAHRHLRRHTRSGSSADCDQYTRLDCEDSHRGTQVVEAQVDRGNDSGQD